MLKYLATYGWVRAKNWHMDRLCNEYARVIFALHKKNRKGGMIYFKMLVTFS